MPPFSAGAGFLGDFRREVVPAAALEVHVAAERVQMAVRRAVIGALVAIPVADERAARRIEDGPLQVRRILGSRLWNVMRH